MTLALERDHVALANAATLRRCSPSVSSGPRFPAICATRRSVRSTASDFRAASISEAVGFSSGLAAGAVRTGFTVRPSQAKAEHALPLFSDGKPLTFSGWTSLGPAFAHGRREMAPKDWNLLWDYVNVQRPRKTPGQ